MSNDPGKKEAQQRVDRIRAFRQELDHLSGTSILVLSEEQRAQLDSHLDETLARLAGQFDVDVSESQKKMSLAMRVASALGGLALCAAVYLFFYCYWGLLSTPLQVAILVIAPIAALAGTESVSRREKTLYYTSLLVLVVLAAFALNLTVLGVIFNIAPSPNAFLAWGIVALILSYRYRLRLPLAAGLIALSVFAAALFTSLNGNWWGSFMERPESLLLGGLAVLLASRILRHQSFPEFPAIYRIFGLLLIFQALLMLANVGSLTFLSLSRNATQGFYQVAGFAVAICAIWVGVTRRQVESVNLGSCFFAVFLFNRLFVWWWDWMPKYLFFLLIGIAALALLAVFRRLRSGSGRVEAA